MSTATLNGLTVLECTVHIPACGIWWADVELGSAEDLTGSVELVVAGLELTGTVMSGGTWESRARYRIAGGAGGWGQSIAARSYASESGVKLSKVLGDAATDCGETLSTSSTDSVGTQWAREAGPASRALALLAAQAWYVGEDGVTYLGARAETEWTGEYTLLEHDEAADRRLIAAPDLTGLVPGALVGGSAAVDVVHRLSDGVLRTTLWGPGRASTGRLSAALARLVETLEARSKYRGLWSYRVVGQTSERLDLQVELSSCGMPDLQQVPVRPGVPGCKAEWDMGSMCLVAFINGDPGRPVVIAADDPDAGGFAPDTLTADADDIDLGDAIAEVLRNGEIVNITGVQPGPGVTAATITVNPATFPGFGASKVKA